MDNPIRIEFNSPSHADKYKEENIGPPSATTSMYLLCLEAYGTVFLYFFMYFIVFMCFLCVVMYSLYSCNSEVQSSFVDMLSKK